MDKNEIKKGLSDLGLKEGDSVILHSSFLSLGYVEGGPDAVIEAFLETLGSKGTLVVPTFGALGILTDILKNRPDSVKSLCNGATVAAVGGLAEKLCRGHWKAETLHGKDTPFTRLAEEGGYVCLLGVDQDRNTTLHSIEALLELPYLNNHSGGFIDEEGNTRLGEWKYFPGPHRDFLGLDRIYRESGKMKAGRIGNAVVRLIKAKDLIDIGLELGKKSPDFVLCDNPNCADCVSQRAAIFEARISNYESFMLAASMRLAGRYVPEAIDNLKDAGISNVELDFINTKPAVMLKTGTILTAVKEFADAGIAVSGMRFFHVPDSFTGMVSEPEVIKAVRRLILSLSGSDEFAADARKSGWKVDFFNQNQTALAAASRLKELEGRIVFNPANFAATGEKPFLRSYSAGRFIKTICALDIVDGLFDGAPSALMCGNAEIKELVSILRCHSFSGIFTLGGGSVFPGSLMDTRRQFEMILDSI
jgi:aminoglycoside 3-N-acetyltransferase